MSDRESRARDDGRPWGFMEADGGFVSLPKRPMLDAGLGPPPFTVNLPDGRVRQIIHQPEPEEFAMAFDPKCYELAEHFLPDDERLSRLKNGLAQHIQDAVEDWLRTERDRLASGAT